MSGCKKENEKEQPKENYPNTDLYLLLSYKNSENPLDNFFIAFLKQKLHWGTMSVCIKFYDSKKAKSQTRIITSTGSGIFILFLRIKSWSLISTKKTITEISGGSPAEYELIYENDARLKSIMSSYNM